MSIETTDGGVEERCSCGPGDLEQDIAPGTDFAGYFIRRLLGSGGFGKVYLAVHRLLRRQVALKILRAKLNDDRQSMELFLREARMVAQFEHPNVVGVYDAGMAENGLAFMAMRLISGGGLDNLIERGEHVPHARILAIMRDCCAGLSAIHGVGLVHRDIKPANILLELDGRACLTDLGISCFHQEFVPGIDSESGTYGTPRYMAPEQLAREVTATQGTDIYALGITFCELATGRSPFVPAPAAEDNEPRVAGDLPDLAAWQDSLGEGLVSLLRSMTARNPDDRPADMKQVFEWVDGLFAQTTGRKAYAMPRGRASAETIAKTQARVREDPLVSAVLEVLPGPALVLNEFRQVVAGNRKLAEMLGVTRLEGLLGRRPGEIVNCVDAFRGPDGCGTGPACAFCGLGRQLSEVEQGSVLPAEGECLLKVEEGSAFELAFRITGMNSSAGKLWVVSLRDVSSEKRRRALERCFIANLLDSAAVVQSMAGSSPGESVPGSTNEDSAVSSSLLNNVRAMFLEEAVFQQHLIAAETGDLQPLWSEHSIPALLADACDRYRRHPVCEGRLISLQCAKELTVRTDRVLLLRAVCNLLKNALEACQQGDTVTVTAVPDETGAVEIRIHNAQVMPPEIQEQVFKPSFSTKAMSGRGIGTYAARLFVESYLQGGIGFTSTIQDGTIFRVRIPARPERETVRTAR